MGNIPFIEGAEGALVQDPSCKQDENHSTVCFTDPRLVGLEFPAYLLGVQSQLLQDKLTSREMSTGGAGRRGTTYTVPLNVDQVYLSY